MSVRKGAALGILILSFWASPAQADLGIGLDSATARDGKTYSFLSLIVGASNRWFNPTLKVGLYPRELMRQAATQAEDEDAPPVTYADGEAYKAELHLLVPGNKLHFFVPSTRWWQGGSNGTVQFGPFVRAIKYDPAPRRSTLYVSGGLGGKVGYTSACFATALSLNLPLISMASEPINQPDVGLAFEWRF